MNRRRTAKVAEAIRQVVSSAILFELKDPRVKNITVLSVEVSSDLRTAKVFVSVLGDEKTETLSMRGLESARGWIQSRIADKLELRLTPVLTFIVDHGIKKSAEISRMLRELDIKPETEEGTDELGSDELTDTDHDESDDVTDELSSQEDINPPG